MSEEITDDEAVAVILAIARREAKLQVEQTDRFGNLPCDHVFDPYEIPEGQ